MFVIDKVNSEEQVDKVFKTEQEAVEYALTQLPSDDFAYIVAEDSGGSIEDGPPYTCIVFQGQEWRP